MTDFASKALISFRQFWVSYQDFTKELLGQFLEDMEAYAEVNMFTGFISFSSSNVNYKIALTYLDFTKGNLG